MQHKTAASIRRQNNFETSYQKQFKGSILTYFCQFMFAFAVL